MSEYKDTTNRHLRHKLQSLGRRLDELEEATSKLQKAEDELLDLQDKIIQAEGSNSSLLAEVETLRKRVLKIEGKDEEIRKAEDLCRSVRERLEEEEKLTKGLRVEIERLQARMAELEKLEEAFGKCKSDCTQLCLSLNEEKNLNRKLSTELEALKARLKEGDASEARLDKAEQALTAEMERLKGLTQAFLSERKRLLEKQREDRELILKLTDKLEQQKNRISSADYGCRDSRDLRIEDELSTSLTSKLTRKKSLDYLKFTDDAGLRNKTENEKNSLEGQEDNKVKDLNQEVEKLKNRLKQLELVEEDLKNTESKNSELLEKFQQEKIRSQTLAEQVEQLKTQVYGSGSNGGAGNGTAKVLENGRVENEDINVRGAFRQEKPKLRSAVAAEPLAQQQKREPKLRNKDLSQSAENSPKSVRRAQSPAPKSRRGPKAGATPAFDNGLKETRRGFEEKSVPGSCQASNSDSKKASVLRRYPPAANDQKSWKTTQKASDVDCKKSRVEKFSKLYGGSDSESNSSDVVPVTSSKAVVALSATKDPDSEQAFANPSQDSSAVLSLSKANGSYTAYRSHVSPAVASDQGSEGHSSASESESTGSRPSVGDQESSSATASGRSANPKYPRYSQIHSDGSSTRSSFDEEGHRALMAEGGSQEPSHSLSGLEIRRVCSPREALRSKAVIKPAIVEIDRKEVMGGSGGGMEPLSSSGKPKISTKPVLTSKMTSSITIYPNDPSSSRTSSRSSSVCSEPIAKERHTSTSNIIIGPSSEHRGSVSIPYEISIPKSDITLRPCQDEADDEDNGVPPSVVETARVETHLRSRSSFSLQSPESTSDFNNDVESGFESSSSSSTTTVTSWRSHSHNHHQPYHHHSSSQDDCLPEMRNVTVRSTWKNRGALSVDEVSHVPQLDGSEDESESTWRAYRATTVLEGEEAGALPTHTEGRGGKLSPAEVYMRRITSSRDAQEPGNPRVRAMQSSPSDSGLGRTVPHEPVSAKERQLWSRKHSIATDEGEPQPSVWRRPSPSSLDPYDRSSRTDGGSSGRTAMSSRSVVGRTPDRSRPWTNRHLDN
ncbi:leucine zipper protein 1 [Alosa pseudoharengus]|uniref:leucine zipper protein 1 n=1 Tax=Alosa pseudoharengus TaxID=34774 RepID=UPI003F887D6A